ncbi:helix-turn-helix domain-containing protein [Alkalihalobacterium bogoriense]|uniref:helix-turn-helix domain-containing protein n=1 Tax=Alkalihalobacterium bogoriense TaxID=246272 RepID=UPI00047CC99A|nr:helix-turn-helix transcriptional regulator [Alkalihalobacterium bogoriense]
MENEFGLIIKRERNNQGLSLAKLSKVIFNELGVSLNASYINRLESGEQQNPSFAIVCALSSALNLDINEVFRAFNYENLIADYNEEAEFTIAELIRLHKVIMPEGDRLINKEEQEIIISIIHTIFNIARKDVSFEDLSPLLYHIQQLHNIQKRYVDTVEVAFQTKTLIFNITVILEQSDLSGEEVVGALNEQVKQKGSKLLDINDELIVFTLGNEEWLAKKEHNQITFIAKYNAIVSF